MASIAQAFGQRSGTAAYTQEYLSRQVVSTLAPFFPLIYFIMARDGNKSNFFGIGNPAVGSLFSMVKSARAREKQIYGADTYQPFIHTTLPVDEDTKDLAMRDTMPAVGGASGSGAVVQATMGGSGTAQYVGTLTVIATGSGYNSSGGSNILSVNITGGGQAAAGTGVGVATGTVGLVNGCVTTVGITASGGGYSGPVNISIGSTGTSSDQHFQRPAFRWYEIVTPLKVFNKPKRRIKNLTYGASRAEKEKAISDLLQPSIDESMVVHYRRFARELWGIRNTSGLPDDQTQEVWNHLCSLPASMQTNNTYGCVDRTVAANAWWSGRRQTSHVAANLVGLYNEAMYSNTQANGLSLADLTMGYGGQQFLLLCGPSLFPQFVDQVRGSGAAQYFERGLPEYGEFGFKRPILCYNNMWVIYDPLCPDKLRTDPRTGSAYTKNAAMIIDLDTITIAFSPESKFSVDEWFDLSRINAEDSTISRIRTETLVANEAPALSMYWEDVG